MGERNDKVSQLQGEIEAGVAALVCGEDWRRWLRVAARLPRYSFRNTLLIQRQCPDATVVMGYRAWAALGHQVRKGEKSICVLAPCTYKTKRDKDDDDRNDEATREQDPPRRVLRGFRLAHLFDLSVTDGDTVKPPAGPTLLEGELAAGLWESLGSRSPPFGFTLGRGPIPSGAKGTRPSSTRWSIAPGRSSPRSDASPPTTSLFQQSRELPGGLCGLDLGARMSRICPHIRRRSCILGS